jgi:hypothetical protein
MKANQLATLVLRLFGIYCLIVFLPSAAVFSSVIFFTETTHDAAGIAAMVIAVLSLAFWVGIGISLIVFSLPWGRRLTGDFAETNVTTLPFEQVQMLAFAVVGILIFAEALPQLLNTVYSFSVSLHHLLNEEMYPPGMRVTDWHTLLVAVGTLLKIGLGLCLFFGAHGFANLWRSFRTFATPKPQGN